MKPRTVAQLLIPVVSTVGLFIIFWVLSFIVLALGYILFNYLKLEARGLSKAMEAVYEFLRVNIFQYTEPTSYDANVNTVVFWIINALAFIVGEIWATNEPDFDE